MANPPEVFILSGPNGAGKSTGAALVLPQRFHISEFVNADEIQKSLGPGASPVTAGRIMIQRMRELRDARESFAFETTLSARTYVPFLQDAQKVGYFIHLAFISLRNPDLAKQRVALRVRRGGHDIPEADIERRFGQGLRNLFDLYIPLVDSWTLCDNSMNGLAVIAQGDREGPMAVHDKKKYDEIRHAAE
jgi:predicted ABC-type ATPase